MEGVFEQIPRSPVPCLGGGWVRFGTGGMRKMLWAGALEYLSLRPNHRSDSYRYMHNYFNLPKKFHNTPFAAA
jgi:hypothetical protein